VIRYPHPQRPAAFIEPEFRLLWRHSLFSSACSSMTIEAVCRHPPTPRTKQNTVNGGYEDFGEGAQT
jgi:hypothetical protein